MLPIGKISTVGVTEYPVLQRNEDRVTIMMQRRHMRTVVKAGISVAVIVGIAFLLRPNREAKALSFVGSGKVIDSETQVIGTSSQYWARIACDPDKVRKFIERHSHSAYYPGAGRIQSKFSDGYMKWPANFEDYSEDWECFEIRNNRWVIVAFNDEGADEVLFVTWSN